MDASADDSDVDAPAGVRESQLIENERVVTDSDVAKVTLAQRRSDSTFAGIGGCHHSHLTSLRTDVAGNPHSIESTCAAANHATPPEVGNADDVIS